MPPRAVAACGTYALLSVVTLLKGSKNRGKQTVNLGRMCGLVHTVCVRGGVPPGVRGSHNKRARKYGCIYVYIICILLLTVSEFHLLYTHTHGIYTSNRHCCCTLSYHAEYSIPPYTLTHTVLHTPFAAAGHSVSKGASSVAELGWPRVPRMASNSTSTRTPRFDALTSASTCCVTYEMKT